jgi:hypothetical protein
MGTHQGPLHRQHELLVRQVAGIIAATLFFNLATIMACGRAAARISSTRPIRLTSAIIQAEDCGRYRERHSLRRLAASERGQSCGLRGQNFGLNLNSFKIGTTYNVSSTSLLGTPDIQLRPIVARSDIESRHAIHQPELFLLRGMSANGPPLPAIYGPAFFNADRALQNFRSMSV